MHRTTITLPESLAELVQREARRRGASVSGLIRTLVEEALVGTAEAPRAIPWAALFDDPGMVSASRIDEALAETWADDLDRDRR